MFIPLQVDVPLRRPPIANVAIIAVAILFFIATWPMEKHPDHPFILDGWKPLGLIGHIWLHADTLHLVGNMLFLWVFGNAVCSKMGSPKYLAAYLGLGLAAAIGHNLFCSEKAIGASGAINGVVGMFLVFFPSSRVRGFIRLFLFYGGELRLPSALVIVLWFLFDLYGALSGAGGIAYWSHIVGFVAGIGLAGVLLRLGIVPLAPGEQTLFHALCLVREDDSRIQSGAAPVGEANHQSQFQPWQQGKRTIDLACSCGKQLAVPVETAGGRFPCPGCGRLLLVPKI